MGVLISIIVPVYNTERYLEQCLDSLLAQTFQDIEIIIVDDESTDSSAEIALRYEQANPNKVKVYSKENGGAGTARNYGFERSKGEYVCFIDSDDYVSPAMFEELYRAADSGGCDMVMCGYRAIDNSDGSTVYTFSFPRDIDFNNVGEVVKQSVEKIPTAPWNKLMSKSLAAVIPFSDTYYEDLATTPIYTSYSKKIGIVDKPLCYYRVNREGSYVDRDKRGLRAFTGIKYAWGRLLDEVNPIYKDQMVRAVYVHVWAVIQNYTAFIDEALEFLDEHRELFLANQYVKEYVQNEHGPDLFSVKFIPRTIHYIRFGSEPLTEIQEKCIASWEQKAPNYKIVAWNESNCDVKENTELLPFKILAEHGGFYLSTDTELHLPIDFLRFHHAFYAFETKRKINIGIMGAIPNCPSSLKILESFRADDSSPAGTHVVKSLRSMGLGLDGNMQLLADDTAVYPANRLTVNVADGQCTASRYYEKEPSYADEVAKEFLKKDSELGSRLRKLSFYLARRSFSFAYRIVISLNLKPVIVSTSAYKRLRRIGVLEKFR